MRDALATFNELPASIGYEAEWFPRTGMVALKKRKICLPFREPKHDSSVVQPAGCRFSEDTRNFFRVEVRLISRGSYLPNIIEATI